MSWTELLKREIEYAYAATDRLLDLVGTNELGWKPSTGSNWMTTGQLLRHISEACGMACRGFVTGDWGLPEGFDPSKMKPEEMTPPAEKMPSVSSVAEARRLLEEDKKVALDMVAESGEEALAHRIAKAPWDATEMILGHRLLQMIGHLNQHKAQLFYYLKLQGIPVNTSHLWG